MFTPIRREFTVNIPLNLAWGHLAEVTRWPTWAKHIKQIDLIPAGEITPQSRGIVRLKYGFRSTFQMKEINLYENWKWMGGFLWLSIHYDHRFEMIDKHHTKLTWTVGLEGLGAPMIGRLFSTIYNKNLNTAIPYLISEMNARSTAVLPERK